MTEEQEAQQNIAEEEHNEEEQESAEPLKPDIFRCPWRNCYEGDNVFAAISSPAPKFRVEAVMPNEEFTDIHLTSYQQNEKWLVLFSIPNLNSSINASEVVAFSQNYHRFQEINAELLLIAPESVFALNAWTTIPKSEGGIEFVNYPLGADIGCWIHKKYGLYDRENDIFFRGTIIIDPEGIVKHISINDPNVGRSVEEILRLVKAFKFSRENGQVCPAKWKEGDMAINPSVNESKQYFETKFPDSINPE